MSEGYRDLRVWQEAKALATDVYLTTEVLRQKRSFGLADQMRRAAVSIPANIAEGRGRSDRDFSRYLLIARGSLCELQTELEIAHDVKLLDDAEWIRFNHETAQVGRMLAGMLRVFRHESTTTKDPVLPERRKTNDERRTRNTSNDAQA